LNSLALVNNKYNLNILIYIPELKQESGGTRQYALGLLKILESDFENNYFILHNNDDKEVIRIVKSSKRNNFNIINKKIGKEKKFESILLKITRVLNFILIRFQFNYRFKYFSYLNRITKKYNINIVHSPFQFTPYSDVKTICTLHDVQELHFPEYFTPFDRFVRSFNYMDSIDRANHIIVSYKHVKHDLIKYFRINDNKVSIVLLDFKEFWINQFLNQKNIFKTEIPKNTPKNYFLYPANTWPHKNHLNLLSAMANLEFVNINLICTGTKNEYYTDFIIPHISKLHLEKNVHFIGIQDEKDLYALYKNAEFVIIPTLYEAGSFPLVEAIILECPVVCSNVTSLPETIGDNRFIFNPTDINQITHSLKSMITDENFRNESRLNSIKQRNRILESECLENILKAYKYIND
jgi:glycosyltransferase involved in cell wall biosynthesis